MQAVHRIPILSAEQERELALRLRDEGDLEAARQLVLAHLRFVVKVARGYNGYGLAAADLIQEGNVGMMKAVKRFNPDLGVRLVSFAVHWIRAEIHQFILHNWRIVKVATTKAQRKLFFKLRSHRKHLDHLGLVEAAEIADKLEVPVREVLEMDQRLHARDLSLAAPARRDDGEAEPMELTPDKLEAGTAERLLPSPEEVYASEQQRSNGHNDLRCGLEKLDARSRDIIESRWLTEDKLTLQTLAARYNVSIERIRQIEAAAMKRLRREVTPA